MERGLWNAHGIAIAGVSPRLTNPAEFSEAEAEQVACQAAAALNLQAFIINQEVLWGLLFLGWVLQQA